MILGRPATVIIFISLALPAWKVIQSFLPQMGGGADGKSIVIIGGGVIGCSSAYYLTRHPLFDRKKHMITVIEATEIAGGSSGKAGGMLATYADPQCLAPLSFKLHADLALEHGGKQQWGYRNIACGEFQAVGQDPHTLKSPRTDSRSAPEDRSVKYPLELDWLIPESVKSYTQVGSPKDTAQIHPYLFTTRMAKLAEERGARIIIGTALSIDYTNGDKAVSSITYRAKDTSKVSSVEATDVLLAAGPWTPSLFPLAPVGGARSHSVVIHPSRPVSGFALWPDISPGPSGRPKESISPEIYSRPDETVYACGPTDFDVPLPVTSDKVAVQDQSCMDIFDAVGSISEELNDGKILVKQACYRPVIMINGELRHDLGPLLGRTGVDGLLIASGHGSWGIQNSPATGKVVSEIIFDGEAKSADITSLDPRNLLKKS